MEILYQSESACVGLLTLPGETADFLTALERIAYELSWQPGDQLRTYQDAALHLAMIVGNEVAGGLQVVLGSQENALPYRHVWPEVDLSELGTAHVTMLALKQQYRGRPGLFGPLCVELWRRCRASAIRQIVIEATPPTLRLYRRIGWPLEIIGDLRPHWGEECCYLCRMGVDQAAEALSAKACRSVSHRALVAQAYRDDPAGSPLTDTACV